MRRDHFAGGGNMVWPCGIPRPAAPGNHEKEIDMTGFKTILWNVLVLAAGAVVPYMAGIDWTQYVSPTAAVIVTAVVNVALRMVTSTPVFKNKSPSQ